MQIQTQEIKLRDPMYYVSLAEIVYFDLLFCRMVKESNQDDGLTCVV